MRAEVPEPFDQMFTKFKKHKANRLTVLASESARVDSGETATPVIQDSWCTRLCHVWQSYGCCVLLD